MQTHLSNEIARVVPNKPEKTAGTNLSIVLRESKRHKEHRRRELNKTEQNGDDTNLDDLLDETHSKKNELKIEKLLKHIEDNVIGRDAVFEGPFGPRKVLYCDYVASGKALNFIEDFMTTHVLPMYGNTHTTTTATSSYTTSLRNKAKNIIREAVNADEDDVVIFSGSGVTGVVHKLISVLNLPKPPIVFCGPFEHHSNLLPWREIAHKVVSIKENKDGKVDMEHLEKSLIQWQKSKHPLIGSFSAASNITGVITDSVAISALLHKYNALALWDYATGGPYMDINMHPAPVNWTDSSKDAIFISMHKFIGSPDAPGLLVASHKLFRNNVPSGCGGGTVLFVSENNHKYLKDIESREEGGTPAIIGSIRAGLAFSLKMSVGCDVIMKREAELYRRAMKRWCTIPELEILGVNDPNANTDDEHTLAVFSFLIRNKETGYYLHYNYVTAVLNDLFGIQSRGGCACAGVYAQHLLGIDYISERQFGAVLEETPKEEKRRKRWENERTEYEVLRPGFTRLNFPYFISDERADFIIEAVAMMAEHGWKLLTQYAYKPRSSEWFHINRKTADERSNVFFNGTDFQFTSTAQSKSSGQLPETPQACLDNALKEMEKVSDRKIKDDRTSYSDKNISRLRWFLLPVEAQDLLFGKQMHVVKKLPVCVRNIGKTSNNSDKLSMQTPRPASKNKRNVKSRRGDDNDSIQRFENSISPSVGTKHKRSFFSCIKC